MSTTNTPSNVLGEFAEWKRDIDRMLLGNYAIDTTNAGLDDDQLRRHWATGETAGEFVKRLALKFDLTTKVEWMARHPISIP
jgi:hypothetical protein